MIAKWLLAVLLTVNGVVAQSIAEEIFNESIQVDEGELVFLEAQDYPAIMHSHNTITIFEKSLTDGVVSIRQCYENMDPVPRMDIVYRYERLRSIRIASAHGIEDARLEGQTVSLHNVEKSASLCVAVEGAILHAEEKGRWVLRNGPFHRKFFDGYFPFHVTLQVAYPADLLTLSYTRPQVQPGVRITHSRDSVTLDSVFAGMLATEIGFEQR